MKKVLIVLLSIIVLLLIIMVSVPIIFKDDIRKAVDDAVAENVNAKVYFDPAKFSLSFFSHFPSLTVAIEDFGIANNAPFEGDTLMDVKKFELAINVMSLLTDKIELNGIYLIEPNIYVKVLKDGRANYDIAKATEEEAPLEEPASEESSEMAFSIKVWEIANANIRYIDNSSDMRAYIKNLTHKGSGDFTLSVFDINTNTNIEAIDFSMEGTDYLNGNTINADLILNMNLDNNTYVFKENSIALNQFVFGFDGSIVLGDDFQDYDLTFSSKETTFKNILSLVPAVFKKDFESLKTSGTMSFDGFAKGKLQGEQIPDFGINLLVNDGMFQYPDLPYAVKNVNLDLNVKKEGASLESTEIDLKKFHMDLGNNPVDITATTKGIDVIDMNVDANVNLNLAEVSSFYPVEGLEMKGLFGLVAKISGTYSETTMPNVNADLKLENGYIKSAEVPAPLENIQMIANAKSAGGDLVNSSFDVKTFKMTFDGNPIEAFLHLENFENYTYSTGLKGQIDLGKLMKIFPQDGMELAGIIQADIKTSGKMSDIDAERYDQLPTSGKISVFNLAFKSEDLPQGLGIKSANFEFNPKEAILRNYNGTLGNSDMQMSGSFKNYLGYVLKDQTLVGNLKFNSKRFDLNEWMSEEEESETEASGSAEEELMVEPIPRNIDFTLDASIEKILYSQSDISNLNSQIVIKDGAINLNQTRFNMLAGTFRTTGKYDTKDSLNPYFSFDLHIEELEIPKAYKAFASIQEMAPMAKNMTGKVNTDFHVEGNLLQNYDPDLASLSGGGLLNIFNAAMKDFKIINKLNSAAKFAGFNSNTSNEYPLSDFLVNAEIRDGKIFFEPFKINAAGNNLTIGGNYGLDGALDYTIKSDISASAITGAAASALNALSGSSLSGSGPVTLNFGVTGTQSDPKVKLLGMDSGDGTGKSVAKTTVTNLKNKASDDARKKAREQADKILAEAKRNADKIRAEGKRSADLIRKQSNEQADALVKKANNPIAKRAAQEAAKKIKKEGEDKARKVENEANRRANQIMNEANKKADSIIKNP
ncbi:MAG: AsmA-like C-terminal region-containing protein [Cytophagales bacterium]